MAVKSETYKFEAETKKVLDLVVRSLYSDRRIFIRELISNASDALDKARYLSLHRNDLRQADGEPSVKLELDKDAGTFIIEDNGIGMTEKEVIENLGTIARSGTKAFLEATEKGSLDSLIGQFGVGFYSAFMVADKIIVETLSGEPDVEAVRWEATGDETYNVMQGDRSIRGTKITLYLKEDDQEFLEKYKVEEIVKRYSNFVSFPIYLEENQINEGKALWTKSAKEITDDEYKDFYKVISNDWDEPASWLHFSADAPMQFHTLVYFPDRKPFDLDMPDGKRGLKLYSHKVLILEEARDLIPRYLRFVKGIVESDDLDLNVSRELLQTTPQAASLKKLITKRILKRLDEISTKEPEVYEKLWENFGTTIKEGIHEDDTNRDSIAKLARFYTTEGDSRRSLKQVLDNLAEGQDAIWYLTGIELDRMRKSPLLERFKRKGWEVVLMDDPVDEWVVLHLQDFEGKPLKSVAKGDIELEDEDDPITEAAREQAKPLLDHLKELLSDEVKEVRYSSRLTDSPSVLVDTEDGLSSNLQKILRNARQDVELTNRVLEINAEHPIVKNLAKMHNQGRTARVEPLARLLLDHARLAEGEVKDPAKMVQRLQQVMLQATLPDLPTLTPEVETITPEVIIPD